MWPKLIPGTETDPLDALGLGSKFVGWSVGWPAGPFPSLSASV